MVTVKVKKKKEKKRNGDCLCGGKKQANIVLEQTNSRSMVNPGAQESETPLPFSPNKSTGCGSEEDEGKMSRVKRLLGFSTLCPGPGTGTGTGNRAKQSKRQAGGQIRPDLRGMQIPNLGQHGPPSPTLLSFALFV